MASFKLTIAMFALLALTYVMAADDEKKPIKCFSCSPGNDCNEIDEDKAKTIDCEDPMECYIAGDADDEKWTRGCGPKDICELFDKENKDKDKYKCSQCKEDKCNSATWLSGGFFLTTAATGIVLAAMRR